MRIFAISRASRFSIGAESRDARIFRLVQEHLCALGHTVEVLDEDDFVAVSTPSTALSAPDCIIHMARSEAALRLLEIYEQNGVVVLNSPTKMLRYNSRVKRFDALVGQSEFLPEYSSLVAETTYAGEYPVWAKAARNDAPAHAVELIADSQALADYVRRAVAAGINHFSMEKPISGTLVKFYGVAGTDFARCYSCDSQFAEKQTVEVENIVRRFCAKDAEALGLTFFGGDAIIDKNDTFRYIDFNDFPSYSRFAEEAASAIAGRLLNELRKVAQCSD